MEHRLTLHILQCQYHGVPIPNRGFHRILFGAVLRNWIFCQKPPFHRIRKGGFKKPVNEVGAGTGQRSSLLPRLQLLTYSVPILSAGRVKFLDGIGAEPAQLFLSNVGLNQVFHQRKLGFVGFGCPAVLAGLNGQPLP